MTVNEKLKESLNFYLPQYNKIINKNIKNEDTKGKTDDSMVHWFCVFLYSLIYNTETASVLRKETLVDIDKRFKLAQIAELTSTCVGINVHKLLLRTVQKFVIINQNLTYQEMVDEITRYNYPFSNQGLNVILLQLLQNQQVTNSVGHFDKFLLITDDNLTQLICPFAFASTQDTTIEIERNGATMYFDPLTPAINAYTIEMPNKLIFTETTAPTITGEVFKFRKWN